MLCFQALPACAWLGGATRKKPSHSTRACSHPQQFTFRRAPATLPCPSLRRGWIVQPNKENPNSAFEISLHHDDASSAAAGGDVVLDDEQVRTNGFRKDLRLEGSNGENENLRCLPATPKYVRGPSIDKKSFVRVYYISALRVPKDESWELAHELRKELLNWPRVNNIASFPTDDVDDDLAKLFFVPEDKKVHDPVRSVRRAVFKSSKNAGAANADAESSQQGSPRPEKLPPATKKEAQDPIEKVASPEKAAHNSIDKQAPTSLELVPEDGENGSNQQRWLGKWPGPSRLLLLAEQHAGKRISELPIDLQAVHSRFTHYAPRNETGLVTCRLTLFYEYWSLDEVLQELLPSDALAPVVFERTGHVAELKLHPKQLPYRHMIAQVFLDKHKSHVRSVVVKSETILRRHYSVGVELLAGRSSIVTTAWEHGNPFRIDMASAVWDSRLSKERQCLVGMFSKDDVVCDVFAGVGLVAIPAGKKVRRVVANDANPLAHFYLAKNVVESRLASKVEIFNQDTHKFLSNVFHVERPLAVTQVVLSHPSASADFLEFFVGAFNRRTWLSSSLPMIHIYGISVAFHPEEDFCKHVAATLEIDPVHIRTTRVAELAPLKWMIRASFVLPSDVGFGHHLQLKMSSSYGR